MKWNQFHTETRMSLQWFFVRLPNDLTSIVLWFQKMQAVRVGDALETLQSLLTTLTLPWLTSHCSLLSRKRICRSGSSGSAMRRVWVAWPGATQTSVDTFVSPAGAKTNYWKKSWVNLSHVEMHRGRKRFDFLFFGRFRKVFVSVPSGSLFASGCANKQTSAGWFYKSSSRSKKGSCKGFLCLGRISQKETLWNSWLLVFFAAYKDFFYYQLSVKNLHFIFGIIMRLRLQIAMLLCLYLSGYSMTVFQSAAQIWSKRHSPLP